jgi:excisionase family DNA binding protein
MGRSPADADGTGNDAGSPPTATRAFSINEFCRAYGIGRTTAYAEIAAGRLRAVKAGGRTLIAADAAETWLASLPEVKPPAVGDASRS